MGDKGQGDEFACGVANREFESGGDGFGADVCQPKVSIRSGGVAGEFADFFFAAGDRGVEFDGGAELDAPELLLYAAISVETGDRFLSDVAAFGEGDGLPQACF
jgi:hypothetical protein